MPLGSTGPLSGQGAVAITAGLAEDQGRSEEATSNVQQRHPKAPPSEPDDAERGRAQRAAIVGQLTGGVLHDFNNVLTVITGTIEILAAAVSDRAELLAIANLIDEAAIRGARLTSHLLAFARGRPSEPVAVDINALMEDASGLLRATLGVEIEIDLTLAIDPPRALADPGQVTAAFLSLAIVARDALPDGGKLGIWTEAAHDEAGRAVGASAVMVGVRARGPQPRGAHRSGMFRDIGLIEEFISGFGGRIEIGSRDGALAQIFLPVA